MVLPDGGDVSGLKTGPGGLPPDRGEESAPTVAAAPRNWPCVNSRPKSGYRSAVSAYNAEGKQQAHRAGQDRTAKEECHDIRQRTTAP